MDCLVRWNAKTWQTLFPSNVEESEECCGCTSLKYFGRFFGWFKLFFCFFTIIYLIVALFEIEELAPITRKTSFLYACGMILTIIDTWNSKYESPLHFRYAGFLYSLLRIRLEMVARNQQGEKFYYFRIYLFLIVIPYKST